jgi:hypothetical protein
MRAWAQNSALESQTFADHGDKMILCCGREAFLFSSYQRLKVLQWFQENVKNSRVATIRLEVLEILCENSRSRPTHDSGCPAEDYPSVLLYSAKYSAEESPVACCDCDVEEDEFKKLIPVLEELRAGISQTPSRRGRCRLHLAAEPSRASLSNEDGSSISKGVAVLSRVNDDINSAFLHLLENPTVRPKRRRNVEYWYL